jgi:hypothetical protein
MQPQRYYVSVLIPSTPDRAGFVAKLTANNATFAYDGSRQVVTVFGLDSPEAGTAMVRVLVSLNARPCVVAEGEDLGQQALQLAAPVLDQVLNGAMFPSDADCEQALRAVQLALQARQ